VLKIHIKPLKKLTAMIKKALETTSLNEIGEDIGLTEGVQLVKAFAAANPEATKGYYIGRNILEQIISQPGCVGINFRKCLTNLNEEHLVYTGVDADGKDILQFTVVTNTGDLEATDAIVADRTIWWNDGALGEGSVFED